MSERSLVPTHPSWLLILAKACLINLREGVEWHIPEPSLPLLVLAETLAIIASGVTA